MAALWAALIDCITPKDIQRVMAALLLEAASGNVAAARLLLAYTVGKPADPANPDRVDVDEWQLLRQTVATQNEVAPTFQSVLVELASQLAQAALPVLADEMGDQLAAHLSVPAARPSTPAWKKRRTNPTDAELQLITDRARRETLAIYRRTATPEGLAPLTGSVSRVSYRLQTILLLT